MHARIVALLLVVATLWSLISVQDLDPSFASSSTAPAVEGSARSDEPRPLTLHDQLWSVQAEIAADLPDCLHERPVMTMAAGPAGSLLRERWLAMLPPYLDGPRRPPRGGIVT